jgi:hypothetical protein
MINAAMRIGTKVRREEAARVGVAITIMLTKTGRFQKGKIAVRK